MQRGNPGLWWPRLAAFVVAALAAASVAYWALKWPASQPATQLQSAAKSLPVGADPAVLARALGARATPAGPAVKRPLAVVDASSRMALVGVVAGSKGAGTALIAIDGKPARPFRVGTKVDGEWLLQSVAPRRAVLATRLDGESGVTLELPAYKK